MWLRWWIGFGSALAGGILAAGSLAGCTVSSPSAAAGSEEVQVRLVNISPNSPPVNLVVGGSAAITNLPYGSVSSYVKLPAGRYDVGLSSPISGSNSPTPSLISSTLATLTGRGMFRILAFDEPARITVIVLRDGQAAQFNKATVRFVNAVPDSSPLRFVTGTNNTLASSLAFGQVSGYQTVDPGFITISVRNAPSAGRPPISLGASTTTSPSPNPEPAPAAGNVLRSFDLQLAAGKVYTIYATGLLRGQPGLNLVVGEETTARPML